ncbi:MAG: hypothetical protein AB3N10_16375 [Allomuricauda sp.]
MKSYIQNLTFCLFAFLFTGSIHAQMEKPQYSFKMDEIAAEFETELRKRKVDTVLQAYYFFDNGRGNKATKIFFWTENGENYVKAIRLAKNNGYKEFETAACP